ITGPITGPGVSDQAVRNISNNILQDFGIDALKPRKPLITGSGAGPGGIPISSGRKGVHNVAAA
ncbi:MAG: hypothetical protein ACK55I_23580, partial [bacterium]